MLFLADAWLQVLTDPQVQAAVDRGMAVQEEPQQGPRQQQQQQQQQAGRQQAGTPPREYVVWGSSVGWLVFYGALTFGWRSVGVEILPGLHEAAAGVAEELHTQGKEFLHRCMCGARV